MNTLYTLEYDLHALHEKIQNNEQKEQSATTQISALEIDLLSQEKLSQQLQQGYQHLFHLLQTEEESLQIEAVDDKTLLEEQQYLEEIRGLIRQAEQKQQQVNTNIQAITKHIAQLKNSMLAYQEKAQVYQKKMAELKQLENNKSDMRNILQAEVFAPVYKTIAIFSSITDLSDEFQAFYQQKREQGQRAVFFMALSGFSMLLLGFVYLLLHMLSQLSLGWWVLLGAIISCAFVLFGTWLKTSGKDTGVLASFFVFFGFAVIYSGLWIFYAYFEPVAVIILYMILLLLNGLIYPFIYLFRMKSLFMLSFSLSMFISVYHFSPEHLSMHLSYLWLLSAVTLYITYRLQWYLSVYIVFSVAIFVLCYFIFPVSSTISAIGNINYLIVIESFFALYLISLLACSDSNQARLAEFFLLLNFILFMTFVYFLTDPQLLSYMYMTNAFALLLGGAVLHLGFRRNIQSVIVWMMAALLFILAIYFMGGTLSPILWGLETLGFLCLGFVLNIRVLRQAAYLFMLLTFCVTLYLIFTLLWHEQTFVLAFSTAWFYFIFIGIFAQSILLLLKYFHSLLNAREKALAHYLHEDMSIWLSIVILYASAIMIPTHWLISALPLSLFLLQRALKRRLMMTEILALMLSLAVLLQLALEWHKQGQLSFITLDWAGQIAWCGLLCLLWAIPYLYKKYTSGEMRQKNSAWLTLLFYTLLPICWLPDVWFFANEWFVIAVWVAAVLAFSLYQWRKNMLYYIENLVLTFAAIVLSLVSFLDWAIPLNQTYQQLSLLIGIAYFMLIFAVLKHAVLGYEQHRYHHVLIIGLYYSVFSILIFAYLFSNFWLLALLLFQLFTFGIAWAAPAYRLLHGQFPFCYISCTLLPIVIIYLIFTADISLVGSLFMLSSVTMAALLIHFRYGHFNQIWDEYRLYDMLLLVTHLWIILTYSALLYQWQIERLHMLLTVFLLCHATMMFLLATMGSHYRLLFKISLGLCALVALKVIFYDLKGDSMFEKVVVLLIFGGLLIFGAYFMQRLAQNNVMHDASVTTKQSKDEKGGLT